MAAWRRFLTAARPLLVVLVAALPAAATADGEVSAADRQAARELFQAGVALAQEGDLPGAIEKFRASYERNPRPVVLFNIGTLQQELGDRAGALETFRRYLEVGGEEIDPERREQVETLVHDLEREFTFVEIAVDETGASVLIGGRPVGSTPLAAPVPVLPGVIEVRVRKEGFDEAVMMVPVPPGETTRVEVTLARAGQAGGEAGGGEAGGGEAGGGEAGGGDENGGEIVWWKEWWFWTAVGAVVLGASVTTGVLLAPDEPGAETPAVWSVYGR
ncbi:MAG: PEGA domain-containing protein [Myxococcales bacterium]|nr:PEGA domain-containing protein [Myxococcales bacterium]